MNQHKRKLYAAKAAIVVLALPFLLYAFAGGPDPGNAGVPTDSSGRTCAQAGCHVGTANSGAGRVAITLASGSTYTPGVTQRVAVRVEDPDQRRWGFQLTARVTSNTATQAGTFATVDGNTLVICANASLFEVNCAPGLRQFAMHSESGTRAGTTQGATFEFDWTPPSTDVGSITFFVAGNAANNDGNNTGDRIYTTTLVVTPAASGPKPSITQGGVVNGASFLSGIAPASWITIRGTNLAGATSVQEYSGGSYPTSAGGVSATVNGKPAFLYFVSAEQLNLISPDDDSTGPMSVVITRSGVASDAFTVQQTRFSPAFFEWPGRQAVATDPAFAFRAKAGTFSTVTTTPAKPGDVLILWGTGFGPTEPVIAAGRQVPNTTPLHSITREIRVTVGNIPATVIGGALAPGFSSLYQIAIQLAAATPEGDQPVVVTIEGASSPPTTVLNIQR